MRWGVACLALLVLASVLPVQAAGQQGSPLPPPETTLTVADEDALAIPMGPPVHLPVTLSIGCHPDEGPETSTQVRFQVEDPPDFATVLITPSETSYTYTLGECPDPEHNRTVEMDLVVRTQEGFPAFTPFPIWITATVHRYASGEPTWTHGPYHANATVIQGFTPRANISVEPEVVRAPAGGTATFRAVVENTANGPASFTLSLRPESATPVDEDVDPLAFELDAGRTQDVRISITDARGGDREATWSAKLLVTVDPADPRATTSVTEQATLEAHFSGQIETSNQAAPGVPTAWFPLALLVAAGAGIVLWRKLR